MLLAPRKAPSAEVDQHAENAVDFAALGTVVEAMGRAESTEEAIGFALNNIRTAFGWDYASHWALNHDGSALIFSQESGSVSTEFRDVTLSAEFPKGIGVSGRAWKNQELTFVEDLADVHDCVRAPAARNAGVKSGVCLPIIRGGRVVGTMDFFTLTKMDLTPTRRAILEIIATLVSQTMNRMAQKVVTEEAAADSAAITRVLQAVGAADTEAEALRTTLDSVREIFGWAYGSVWMIGVEGVLKYAHQSGTVNDEFEQVTQTATFAYGVGLAGRVWSTQDLIFVPDLSEVSDCVRAPIAQRAGVKSGVCMPLMVGGEVVATIDFFATETLDPNPSRLDALRTIAKLVSQSLEKLRRSAEISQMAGELSASVEHVAVNAAKASEIAGVAVERSAQALNVMQTLGESSQAIGNIAKVISGIAEQTNLLALNATIEAARAGDAGKGFAVVASEVKELARETSTATDDVTEKIGTIQQDSTEAAAVIQSVGETIEQIHEIQNNLASVLEEQSTIAQAFRSESGVTF